MSYRADVQRSYHYRCTAKKQTAPADFAANTRLVAIESFPCLEHRSTAGQRTFIHPKKPLCGGFGWNFPDDFPCSIEQNEICVGSGECSFIRALASRDIALGMK
jgi:hypothetical protein